MPNYKYKCRGCKNSFIIKASLEKKDKGLDPECPDCGGGDVFQSFDSVGFIGGGSKSKSKSSGSCSSCSGNLSCCG